MRENTIENIREIKEFKVVTSTYMAKILLDKGFKIINIKPHKDNADKTVFVFENSKELENVFDEIKGTTRQ